MGFLSSILDFSNLRKIDCKNDKLQYEQIRHVWMNHLYNKEFIEDYLGLVYPYTNNIDYAFNKFESEKKFADKVNENIMLFNSTDTIKINNYEIQLLKNNKNIEINIDLKYDEKLSRNRNKIIEEKKGPKLYNILFVYIDSLSRSHFFRKMKSVSHFFEKFNNKKNSSTNYESFQFLKYQTFKNDYYKSSTQTMFYNKTKNPNKNIQNTHLLSILKRNGYVTGQSANICSKEFFSYDFEKETKFFKNTLLEEFDHENIAMFCDPFYFDDSKDKNPDSKYVKGINSSIKRCLYGKNSFEYVLEYGYQFWSTYKNNKRFLRLGFSDGNEKTGEVIKYLDSYLYGFLYKLFNENYLKDTILFIVSGQGNIYTEFYNNDDFEDFLIEKYIGSLFIFVDKSNIGENNLKNIRKNQQNMVTPYDIKETLVSIMYNNFSDETKKEEIKIEEFSQKGKSLFNYINSKERNCEKYKQTTEEVCRCHDFH
jgi:hypothetical protein